MHCLTKKFDFRHDSWYTYVFSIYSGFGQLKIIKVMSGSHRDHAVVYLDTRVLYCRSLDIAGRYIPGIYQHTEAY